MDERPIFVLGCPRSGTTMLQLMLHSHPRIAIPPENRFVLPAYYERRSFGDLAVPENRRALAQRITGRGTLFKDFGLRRKQIVERIVAGPPTVGSAVGTVLRAYAEKFDKPRWGDKRPGYFQHVPAILRMFPNAQIIHLVRDGRACVASLDRMSWWRQGTVGAVSTWAEAIDHGRSAATELGPDSYHRLRYEDLIADPAAELEPLCDFLGETYDPAMADPRDVAEVALPERKTWHDRARQAPTVTAAGSWRETLAPEALALCEAVLGNRLRSEGYELVGAPRPPMRLLAEYSWVALQRRVATRKRRITDQLAAFRAPNPVADQT